MPLSMPKLCPNLNFFRASEEESRGKKLSIIPGQVEEKTRNGIKPN